MDMQELVAKRADLTNAIGELVNTFNNETGFFAKTCELNYEKVTVVKRSYLTVKITLELP